MSLAIYTFARPNRLEITFALEQILLTRKGDTFVSLDLLLRNTGQDSVRQVRLALPYALVHLSRLDRVKSEETAERAFGQLRRAQLENIRIMTDELAVPQSDRNWIYRTLAHARIDRFDSRDGTITVEREGQEEGSHRLSGFVKRGWRVLSPLEAEIDQWTWFLLAINEITLVDIAVPEHYRQEQLFPRESMWLRIKFRIPAFGINKHSFIESLFSPSLVSRYVFMSPRTAVDWMNRRIQNFRVGEIGSPEGLVYPLHLARQHALELLRHEMTVSEIKDWRVFLYQEPNITVEQLSYTDGRPRTPRMTPVYELPPAAFATTSGTHAPFNMLPSKPRHISAHEFWIGSDHGLSNREHYMVEVCSRSHSAFYTYTP
ncbi:MAG: hypothetical protein L0Z50_07830, partial [Verrucomicrobiales bacterium]|nr:hypothetical protein [Verrucomicrobiales bacterium]